LAAGISFAVVAIAWAVPANKTCLVKKGVKVNPKIPTVKVNGKELGFC